ncbi:hypothetical protein, partial [Aeromonas salmonicida]|uniref:hypothetical protein n=1 Tax=Aeromonas salmonicida TaxID=645 RepID=UPI00259ED878
MNDMTLQASKETATPTQPIIGIREFNFEVQFPIKNQAAFRSSSKTTCGCLNPKHLRGLKFSRFS